MITKEEMKRRRTRINFSREERVRINSIMLITLLCVTFLWICTFMISTNSKITKIENTLDQITTDIEDLSTPIIYQITTETQPVEESVYITENIIVKPVTLEEKYASVFDWQVYTGDFGAEQLYYLKDQCDRYEIPMEIMLSLICTESSFRSTAKSSASSAAGYCQLISGTAEWVYEDLLKYGDYNKAEHSTIMTTNWRLNIEMACELMDYLYWHNGESWSNAIQRYYGSKVASENHAYLNKVNKNMNELFNTTISNL